LRYDSGYTKVMLALAPQQWAWISFAMTQTSYKQIVF
jgi:hypothetical protein